MARRIAPHPTFHAGGCYTVKRQDLRRHLKPYSIARQRTTTINHAFASALAMNGEYDDRLVAQALRALGQDPDGDLQCVYCGRPAEGWDHVTGLVKGTKYVGFGHTIGNLLPCCKGCNSQKGNKDWRDFLRSVIADEEERTAKMALLDAYLARYRPSRFGYEEIANEFPQEVEHLQRLRDAIIELMREADQVAADLRGKVRAHLQELDDLARR